MLEFFATAVSFPAVVFSAALVVVVLYWLLLLVGADLLDSDSGGGLMDTLGVGGVPATVVVSLWVTLSWLLAMAATVGIEALGAAGTTVVVLGWVALVVAVLGGLLLTRLIAVPIRRAIPERDEPTRGDFVGRTCVIRTGTVSESFGQAEITADDGSTSIIQVRQSADLTGERPLRAGSNALIFEYDQVKEIFWVTTEFPEAQ